MQSSKSQDFECQSLLFDVFGTLVDWRSSVTHGLQAFFSTYEIKGELPDSINWEAVAVDWRARYQPSMQAVRDGRRDFVVLDVLHRESLIDTLNQHGIHGLEDTALDAINHLWHTLNPWPDVSAGLYRLRTHYTLAAVSNGNTQLLKDLSTHADLPWHVSLGAEPARAYKPVADVYLYSAAMLACEPAQCMMVAAHNEDLEAARALGFRTAYVNRPTEYGAWQSRDKGPESDWDFCVSTLSELADKLLINHD